MKKMTYYLPEILDQIAAASSREEQIKLLKHNDTQTLRSILHFGLHPKYSKAFKVIPPYRADDAPYGYSSSNLSRVHNRLSYLFKENPNYIESETKRQNIAALMMESVHFTEAVLLEKILSREFNQISLSVAKEAFPQQFEDA
jgi:hypothetical protein